MSKDVFEQEKPELDTEPEAPQQCDDLPSPETEPLPESEEPVSPAPEPLPESDKLVSPESKLAEEPDDLPDPDTESQEQSPKKSKKFLAVRITLICCCVLEILLLLAAIGVGVLMFIVDGKLNLINRPGELGELSASEYQDYMDSITETMPEDYTGVVIDPNTIVWGDIANPLETSNGVINILLIGQDRRANESGRTRSDSMILCTLNKNTNTLTLTSFMRDMYIKIPGYYSHRLNTSYFLGGMTLLDKTLEQNFGVQVDGNVEVDVFGFIDCIDLMGGVEIELTQAEANYLNRRGNWDYTNDTGWTLTAGVNHMTGTQAVAYSRIRDIGNGDFGRTERQRKMLTALFEKARDLSLPELNALLNKFLPLLTTDLNNNEILGYAWALFSMMSDLEIKTMRIPADGACYDAWAGEMMVLMPNLEKNRQILAKIMADE